MAPLKEPSFHKEQTVEKSIAIVFTGSEDPMWPFLFEACNELERENIVLYQTDKPRQSQCSYDPINSRVEFCINGKTISGKQIRSVWLRRFVTPALKHLGEDLANYSETEYADFFDGMEFAIPNALWVSKPSAIATARNKARQLHIAREIGFLTMDTLFTNPPRKLSEFAAQRKSIYKSIRSPRVPVRHDFHSTVFTTVLTQEIIAKADGILSCPAILQSYCKKTSDIRVTVFGEKIFPIEIASQTDHLSETDFRTRAKYLEHKPHQLPLGVSEKCVEIVAKLGLRFGAIDLALTETGDYYFFEVNPNGQWGWLEQKTGLPMRRALLDLLF